MFCLRSGNLKLRNECKECVSNYNKLYRENNKQKIAYIRNNYYLKNKQREIDRAVKWGKDNKERRKEIRLKWDRDNKEKKNSYSSNREKYDISFKIRRRLSTRIRQAMMGGKNFRTKNYIGCSLDDLRTYLQSKFKEGMTWDNYGYNGWHIDHIKPLSLFDLSLEEEKIKAFNYTNLQPLWKDENFKKGNKYEQ